MSKLADQTEWLATDAGIMRHWLACCNAACRHDRFFTQCGLDDRLQRLFAVACCRRIWPLMTDARSRAAVEAAELFAEGRCGSAELNAARVAADDLADARARAADVATAAADAAAARAVEAARARAADVATAAVEAAELFAEGRCGSAELNAARVAADAARACAAANAAEWKSQGLILISFMAPEWTWEPTWKTSTVAALATGIYEEKAFDRMPILADALMDSGCLDERIIVPLQTQTEWYRGCRILDCILGKRQ